MTVIKQINNFFNNSTKHEIDTALGKIYLTDRQEKIYQMRYVKGNDIGFIADSLCVTRLVIDKELHAIRNKLIRVI